MHLFEGRTPGKIIKPQGPIQDNPAWDGLRVFVPDGYDITLAEMVDKCEPHSVRSHFQALEKFKKFLLNAS